MQSWILSLMFLTLITSPWLLSAIAFHGSSLFHSFYISDCFLVVHLVLRHGSFLRFALPILPLYSLLISGPKSNLCLYTGFKSTSPLLIFLLVLSPTSHYFAIYSVNTKLIPNYSVLLLETSYCVRVGSVIIFILVKIICYSSSGFSLVWALNVQDVFKNKQMQCRCGLMVQSSNCEDTDTHEQQSILPKWVSLRDLGSVCVYKTGVAERSILSFSVDRYHLILPICH